MRGKEFAIVAEEIRKLAGMTDDTLYKSYETFRYVEAHNVNFFCK